MHWLVAGHELVAAAARVVVAVAAARVEIGFVADDYQVAASAERDYIPADFARW